MCLQTQTYVVDTGKWRSILRSQNSSGKQTQLDDSSLLKQVNELQFCFSSMNVRYFLQREYTL